MKITSCDYIYLNLLKMNFLWRTPRAYIRANSDIHVHVPCTYLLDIPVGLIYVATLIGSFYRVVCTLVDP